MSLAAFDGSAQLTENFPQHEPNHIRESPQVIAGKGIVMNREEALRRLRAITVGIDRDQTEDDTGWWETSTGTEFGAAKFRELEQLISDLTESSPE